MNIRTVRKVVGTMLALIFLAFVGLMTLMALDAQLGSLPGYPIFYFGCIALVVCCLRFAAGNAHGATGVQFASTVAILGVLLDAKDRHEITFWAIFVTPIVVAAGSAQLIKERMRVAEYANGETN
jgi:hypothetical protein